MEKASETAEYTASGGKISQFEVQKQGAYDSKWELFFTPESYSCDHSLALQ